MISASKRYTKYQDFELVQLLKEEDEKAYAEIYRRYWDILLGMSFNRLKDLQASEDIVHDIFASLWKNRLQTNIESLKNYLAAAVKYLILKAVKKEALHHIYTKEISHTQPFSTAYHSVFDQKKIAAILDEQVNNLPEKCRLVFLYSRERGMNTRQIAEEMSITPKTVENQMNKALRHIRLAVKNLLTFLFSFF